MTSCSLGWSPLSHTSRPCPSSCSCFSRGKMGQKPSQSCKCVCVCVSVLARAFVHTSGPGEWHEYLIPSNSQSPQALAGCRCLHLNVAHKVFLATLRSKSLTKGRIQRHNLTCLWGCYLQTGKPPGCWELPLLERKTTGKATVTVTADQGRYNHGKDTGHSFPAP